jgi:predicted nucleic acid-binding protein
VTTYIDSSSLLRILLGQRGRLKEWKQVARGVASALVEVECLRTLDRLRLRGAVSDDVLASLREGAYRLLDAIDLVEPSRPVLARAAQPFPTSLGSLDAIHLATALLWAESERTELVFATHDATLGLGARASGFRVIGL